MAGRKHMSRLPDKWPLNPNDVFPCTQGGDPNDIIRRLRETVGPWLKPVSKVNPYKIQGIAVEEPEEVRFCIYLWHRGQQPIAEFTRRSGDVWTWQRLLHRWTSALQDVLTRVARAPQKPAPLPPRLLPGLDVVPINREWLGDLQIRTLAMCLTLQHLALSPAALIAIADRLQSTQHPTEARLCARLLERHGTPRLLVHAARICYARCECMFKQSLPGRIALDVLGNGMVQ